jgi:hypothetical protein
MNIDRNNYEVYFLDYLEGRLTTEETAALLLFANENPDLKEMIEGEELINLVSDEKISFYPKSALKKKPASGIESVSGANTLSNNKSITSGSGINIGNYEEFMIRFYENDLEDAEKSDLADFLKDSPMYIKEFEVFGNTLLKPDTGVIYPHKSRLKRKQILLPQTKRIFAIVSVAASVLLFSTLFLKYINEPSLKENNNLLAGANNKTSETVKSVTSKDNTASIRSTDINHSANSDHLNKTSSRKATTSNKSPVELMGGDPASKRMKATTTERTTFEIPSSLIIKQSSLLASAQINAPKTIDRRTDFDGITSVAYYDPDPDALPLKTEGRTIGGRLGYTLANGISQTAGTIAREPELGRLLRGKVSLSDLAGLGLAGFNLITDSKLSVSRNYDVDGNLKGYSIVDGNKRLKR